MDEEVEGGRAHVGRQAVDQKTLPVGRNVVNRSGPRVNSEKWNRCAGVELRVGADGYRHEFEIRTQIEQLFPVTPPAGKSAAGRRDLPRSRSRGERAHVDLGASG